MVNKIVLFTDSLGPGGAQRQLCGLAVMLSNHNFDVLVLTYHSNGFYKSHLEENGIQNVIVGDNCSSINRILAVKKFLIKENPDWVIAYQETPSLIASFVKLLGGKFKLIVSERNTTQQLTLKDKIRFFLYRYATAVVPNSYSQENFLASRYGWMKKKLCTITNFVDLNNFSFNRHIRNEIPLIVIAASIWPPKNTLGFIEALRILASKDVLFKVKWYGYSEANVEYFQSAQAKIDEYQLNEYIELLPKTKHIQEVYRLSDYFCLPSFYEGVPNVIAEAMATGRPILCSNVCDNPRYVIEGVNGYLFDPNNPENMAEQILKGLSVPDQVYSQMCQESRKRAEEMLSMDTFINKYIEIIEG